MKCKLLAFPANTLVDEDVNIEFHGFQPCQEITLMSLHVDERKHIFECFAFYKTDEEGTVKLSRDASVGGMYVGVEPMGLFWAMESSSLNKFNHSRLIKRDCYTPKIIKLSVYENWKNCEDMRMVKPLAITEVYRWFKSEGVKREPVKHGSTRGTLFIPEGQGPFPTVIDIFGAAGGLFEFRAAMLATRGFLTLALAVFNYDDLPKEFPDSFHLEYFEDAVLFVRSRPECAGAGVGVVGTSLGGTLSMAIGGYVPGVKAVICINAGQYADCAPFYYKGYQAKTVEYDISRIILHGPQFAIEDGPGRIYEDIDTLPKNLLECHKSDCKYLLLASGDDGSIQMDVVAKDFIKIKNKFKLNENQWKLKYYEGAGHLLDLPNTPLCNIAYFRYWENYYYYGGKKVEHAKAQIDAWQQILHFFSESLESTFKAKL